MDECDINVFVAIAAIAANLCVPVLTARKIRKLKKKIMTCKICIQK